MTKANNQLSQSVIFPQPKRLTIQWHITDRCNLRCSHCYQESYRNHGPDLHSLIKIAQQVFDLHSACEENHSIPLRFTLTGGEPCIHPEFAELIEYLASHPSHPSLAVLSNGSLINADWAARFAKLNVAFVQLSVEGSELTHDAIRGRSHFQQVVQATQHLVRAGVRVLWSFTAHNNNWQEFSQVAELAQQYKVDKIWSDRMIPTCHKDAPLTLNSAQSTAYFQHMHQTKRHIESQPSNTTEVSMCRALQFQEAGQQPYQCNAGNELITLMPDGSVLPCRRLPITVGNLFEKPLTDIYFHAPLLQQLRNFSAPEACSSCLYRTNCRGGLRCLAYAVHGSPFQADPGCRYLSVSHQED
ncbi:radical SAM/SPASM domain-containing protein [Pragia fontium]|uniref:radical SAM/SPASM domain-containing protein n=1 Tax=Pragia fontium TaxID=82985 RepID=UPI0021C31A12|nr:radical SAM protein [Pragia fontium]